MLLSLLGLAGGALTQDMAGAFTQDSFEVCDRQTGGGSACVQAILREDADIADAWARAAVPPVRKTSERLRRHQNPVGGALWVCMFVCVFLV